LKNKYDRTYYSGPGTAWAIFTPWNLQCAQKLQRFRLELIILEIAWQRRREFAKCFALIWSCKIYFIRAKICV
jgi:hypothetical protein